MLRFLADENFNGTIVRGVRRGSPELDILTVHEAALTGTPDPELLGWAASQGRLLLTHDVKTMPRFINDRVEAGLPMPGVVEVPMIYPIRQVIEDIVPLYKCSDDGEWEGQIVRVPM